jgi:dTDP-4-dehydrorhamnose 3,5-epimerase
MRVIETQLPGVMLLEPQVHRDARGFFMEVYHVARLEACGIHTRFVQENQSRSGRGTLRGLHWQYRRPQAKLVRVLSGEIFDVAVDIRRGSPTFGAWEGMHLSADNFRQTFIPEGFAHGFCVLSETADVDYKCSDYYDPGGEAGLAWDDPVVGISWPVPEPLLSLKDRAFEPLNRHDRYLPALGPDGELLWRSPSFRVTGVP